MLVFAPQGIPLWHPESIQKNMSFQDIYLHTLFDDFMLILCENGRCWKVGPKSSASVHLTFRGPGTDLFPESIRIEVLMIFF